MAKTLNKPSPEDIYFLFFKEINILEQLSRAIFENHLPSGFLLAHFAILNHLMLHGEGATPLKLSRVFQVPKTTMTHSLNILMRHSLIEMKTNPKDGRSKLIYITQQGVEFRDESIKLIFPSLQEINGVFSSDKIKDILPSLIELREKLDSLRDL